MNTTDPLEDLLRSHLHQQLDDAPVAAARLAHGARKQAVRIRRRRTVATSAGVAFTVIGITVAATQLNQATPPPVAPAASASQHARITDAQMLRTSDIPWRMDKDPSEVSRNTGPTGVHKCPVSASDDVLAARSIQWYAKKGERKYAVEETITAWGDATTAMRELIANTGVCMWIDKVIPLEGSTKDLFLATADSYGPGANAIGVRRDGNRLISVVVYGPDNVKAAALVAPMRQLMARAHTRATS